MKLVEIVLGYKDMQLNRPVSKGEVFEVDDNRFLQLEKAGVAKLKENATPDVPLVQYDLTPPQKTEETYQGVPAPVEMAEIPDKKTPRKATITPKAKTVRKRAPAKKDSRKLTTSKK